jgi:hypothetical protein
MKRGVVLRRVSEQEFDDSIAWYESEREGLGQVFEQLSRLWRREEQPNRGLLGMAGVETFDREMSMCWTNPYRRMLERRAALFVRRAAAG